MRHDIYIGSCRTHVNRLKWRCSDLSRVATLVYW